jgi:hypothetical protein
MKEFLIVFFAQIGFLYFRTINVIHTSKGHVWKAITSGTFVGMLWIITTGMGVTAFINFQSQWHVIVGHLVGGAIGTYIGMRKK